MMLKEIDIFSCLMRIKTYFKNLIFLNQGGRERVSNPFLSLPETLPLYPQIA